MNVFVNTAFSISSDRVEEMIADAEVITLGIGTGVALRFALFGATTRAFALGVENDFRFRLQDSHLDS